MDFQNYAQKGNQFLAEVSKELGEEYNTVSAGRIVRAVFHVLRKILSIEESFQLMAQLPMALKSVYVEGWKLNRGDRKIRHMDDFISAVIKEDGLASYSDFTSKKNSVHSIEAVFKVLNKHISPGEMEDIKAVLPKSLKVLCDVK